MTNRLTIIDCDDKLIFAWTESFKQYASIPDDGRDALLQGLLRSAILRVQEYADRAIMTCRVRQIARSDAETGQIRLYLGGGEELAVTELNGAVCPAYVVNTPNSVTVPKRGAEYQVEFTTVPNTAWMAQAQATVFRLATALYDGEQPEVCNAILNEVL